MFLLFLTQFLTEFLHIVGSDFYFLLLSGSFLVFLFHISLSDFPPSQLRGILVAQVVFLLCSVRTGRGLLWGAEGPAGVGTCPGGAGGSAVSQGRGDLCSSAERAGLTLGAASLRRGAGGLMPQG